jgi:hypothetical protein
MLSAHEEFLLSVDKRERARILANLQGLAA